MLARYQRPVLYLVMYYDDLYTFRSTQVLMDFENPCTAIFNESASSKS